MKEIIMDFIKASVKYIVPLAIILYSATSILRAETADVNATVVDVYQVERWNSATRMYDTDSYTRFSYEYNGNMYTAEHKVTTYDIGDIIKCKVDINRPHVLYLVSGDVKEGVYTSMYIILPALGIFLISYSRVIIKFIKRYKIFKQVRSSMITEDCTNG